MKNILLLRLNKVRTDRSLGEEGGFLADVVATILKTQVRDYITLYDYPSKIRLGEYIEQACATILLSKDLELSWKRTVFIEYILQDPDKDKSCADGYASLLKFDSAPYISYSYLHNEDIPRMTLSDPSRSIIPPDLAASLIEAGALPVKNIGKTVILRDNGAVLRARVTGYDGQRYYTSRGVFPISRVIGVAENTSQSFTNMLAAEVK